MDVDAVVIGAGVVGLACAERLASAGKGVVVVERHATFGQETSSRNSEVIHAGIHYPTGSLKAQLCLEGNRALYAWCERHGVPHARLGKYIVATDAEEEASLESIKQRARANSVELTMTPGKVVTKEEPNVRAVAALWSPTTGIVDSHAFMESLVRSATEKGCSFAWKHTLVAVEHMADGYCVTVRDPVGTLQPVRTRAVINAAGLAADEVAALGGIDVDAVGYRQTYVVGRYFRVRQRNFVRHLVYPVPPRGLAGLGVHVTLDLAGGVRLGPDVHVLGDRVARYDVPEELAGVFLEWASRYLVGLSAEDLSPDQAGIRPKLGVPGGAVRDFVVTEESARGMPGWVNLVGIESPGLTASLAIASRVLRVLAQDV